MATHDRTRRTRARCRDERGIALVMALFALSALLVAAASGFLVGSSDLNATRNYRGAGQVHLAAESGISEAVQVVNKTGIVNWQNEVVNRWNQADMWGAGTHNGPANGFSYTVTPFPVAANPADLGWFRATATGPDNVTNIVVANIVRTNIPTTSPGAVYLATDGQSNCTFNGNNFFLDGNDHNYTGGAGPAAPVPGLSTRHDPNTQEAIQSLSQQELDNVQGLGYSPNPLIPSVKTSPAAPTVGEIEQIVQDMLGRGGVVTNQVVNNQGKSVAVNNGKINGGDVFGTTAAPRITHLTTSVSVGNGNASGAGILIVDGDLTIDGTLDFKGLIIVRGVTQTKGQGSALVYGSLWTDAVNLTIGGAAQVLYSTQALALANNVQGGGALPSPIQVTALIDCNQVPPATSHCP